MPRGSNYQKPFPPEFRREAVELYRRSGRSLREIASDLGVRVSPKRASRRRRSPSVTVGGASVRVTGLDALRATGNDTQGTGTGVLLGTLLAALGALLVLGFVFRSFTAVIPLLMAVVAIPTRSFSSGPRRRSPTCP